MINFKETYYDENELKALRNVLERGHDYIFGAKKQLSKIYGTENIFLTTSGSTAIDLFFLLYDFPKCGEVILPSFTYPSLVNSILRAELIPVFCDIDTNTLVADINDIKAKITEKTVCIAPTHYGGASIELDELKDIAGDICIFEDASLSINAYYKEKPLGMLGNASVVSFHKTKNISSDEGGMLIINDEHMLEKAQMIYDNGTNRSAFKRGEVPYYSWQMKGVNVTMSNFCAAVLTAQLNKLDHITTYQTRLYNEYMENLKPLVEEFNVILPTIPMNNKNNAHVFYILLKDEAQRAAVKQHLEGKSIQSVIHYVPLHQSRMGEEIGYLPMDLPKTYDVSERILRLPIHANMKMEDCGMIAREIWSVLCGK